MKNKQREAEKVALSDDEKFSDKKLYEQSKNDSVLGGETCTSKGVKHLLINEVCEITRKSRVTIWNWKKMGVLTPVGKSGKNPIYLEKDVLDFLYGSNLNQI